MVNILAVGLILGVCWLVGLAAKRAFLSSRMQRIDGFLIDMIPGYAVFKTLVSSASADQTLDRLLRPVMVRFDDYDQIAFMTESGETQSVLFLPGSPSAWSGGTVIVDNARITELDLPAHQATRLFRTFGRGSLAALEKSARPGGDSSAAS